MHAHVHDQPSDPTPTEPRTRCRRARIAPIALIAAALAVLVAGVVLWTVQREIVPDKPRNVLLITMDTTRTDYLGCYGRATARTPNIDALAANGTRFTRVTSCAPTTLPSHCSIMTGLYPYAHGVRLNGEGRLADSLPTLAEAFQIQGYRTAATVACFVLNRRFGLDQGFDTYLDVPPGIAEQDLAAERSGDAVCDDALELLGSFGDDPFFLWVHFFDPHHPYRSPRTPDINSPAAYEDEIAFMDIQIGRLLRRLEELGRDHDTLVVALADHGEGLGDHDEMTHGHFLYETTINVPLIVRVPGASPAGRVVETPVRTIDVAPTILALLEAPPLDGAQGVSVAGLLTAPAAEAPPPAYAESFVAWQDFGVSPLRSLTHNAWKYIHAPTPELYHLADDPGEHTNRAEGETDALAALRERLWQLLADAPAPPSAEESGHLPTAEELRALEALGYVAGGAAPPVGEGDTELDHFEPVGPNPRDHAQAFTRYTYEVSPLMARGDFEAAEALLREILAALPMAQQARMTLARALYGQGRVDEALATAREAVDAAPDDHLLRHRYALFLGNAGRYEDALVEFGAVLERVPNDTEALEGAAIASAALGQTERAYSFMQRILEIDGRHPRALRAVGLEHLRRGEPQVALEYLDRALASDPNCADCAAARQRILDHVPPVPESSAPAAPSDAPVKDDP